MNEQITYECENCHGTGYEDCPLEWGEDSYPDLCPACGGSNKIICTVCNGTGQVDENGQAI